MPDTPRPLDEIRTRISQLDQELLTLLAERRRLSLDVAKNKVAVQKPIRDQAREQALLEELVTQAQGYQLDAHYVLSLFHTIIEDSVLIQQRYLQNLPIQTISVRWHGFLSWAARALIPIWLLASTLAVSKPNWWRCRAIALKRWWKQ